MNVKATIALLQATIEQLSAMHAEAEVEATFLYNNGDGDLDEQGPLTAILVEDDTADNCCLQV